MLFLSDMTLHELHYNLILKSKTNDYNFKLHNFEHIIEVVRAVLSFYMYLLFCQITASAPAFPSRFRNFLQN